MRKCTSAQLIDRFKKYRLDKDLTLQDCADDMKLSVSALAHIENNKTKKPHKRTLHKIKIFIGEA